MRTWRSVNFHVRYWMVVVVFLTAMILCSSVWIQGVLLVAIACAHIWYINHMVDEVPSAGTLEVPKEFVDRNKIGIGLE